MSLVYTEYTHYHIPLYLYVYLGPYVISKCKIMKKILVTVNLHDHGLAEHRHHHHGKKVQMCSVVLYVFICVQRCSVVFIFSSVVCCVNMCYSVFGHAHVFSFVLK